ncbi:MAG: hypothetical protein J6S74_01615 [Alphaproteobacteria bacterium]|nr:hypothetical protein [Alphaproteobacteria bacterium]
MLSRWNSLLCLLFVVFSTVQTYAVEIDTNIVGDYNMNSHTTITPNGSFSGGVVNVSGGWTIINYGSITSDMNICDYCNVRIENAGIYNADTTLGTGATITQVINNSNDITELSGIDVGYYNVEISGAENPLNWDNILANTGNAAGYNLLSAKLQIGNIVTIDKPVVLNGITFLYVDGDINSDVVLFSNVSGDGTIRVSNDNVDALHVVQVSKENERVYLRLVRSGDYGRILNNDVGRFLNSLREKSPSDKLLRHMDRANSEQELKRIISRSIRIHPIKMMKSIKTLYSHKIVETMRIDHDFDFGIMPISIFSTNMRLFGFEPNMNIKLDDDLRMNIYGHFSYLNYADDINEYSGLSFGGGVDTVYDLPLDNFVRAYGGINYTAFDVGPVFDGSGKIDNPGGWSGFVNAEIGHRFVFDNDYFISPYVLLGGNYMSMLNKKEFGIYSGIGGDAGYKYNCDGLEYTYAMRGVVRSNENVGLDINVSVWSVIDAAGADFKFGVLHDGEFGLSYHISLNARFDF